MMFPETLPNHTQSYLVRHQFKLVKICRFCPIARTKILPYLCTAIEQQRKRMKGHHTIPFPGYEPPRPSAVKGCGGFSYPTVKAGDSAKYLRPAKT